MSAVGESARQGLKGLFGDRVRFGRVERKLYSSDIGSLPRLVKPFVQAGIAGAVVRPVCEDEVRDLVRLARGEGLRLVPRAASTSGYGGVLPQDGAVVVDMSAMDAIVRVDSMGTPSATVEAGARWEDLLKRVNKLGFDLRSYPSSLPSSTVGGWLAQGGSGFGSYEFGPIRDNVLAARVVLPSGEIVTYNADELRLYVADAEGTTGIITEVTVALRPQEVEVHRLFSLPDAAALVTSLAEISNARLPIWSLTFLNPESVRLKKRLPHRHGHPYEVRLVHAEPDLPESYLLMVAYPESRRASIDERLVAAVVEKGGQDLGREAAEHEWDQRFAPMRLKRVGPSIIPTEVVVPLAGLGGTLSEIESKINQPFVLEGMVGKGDQVVLLGFIPHDERTFAFNAAFALSLSVIGIAKRHGGSAYSTGLYFRREAPSVLGEERYRALVEHKKSVDPVGMLNPGKVVGSGALDALMGAAAALEPLVRPIANRAVAPTGDMVGARPKNGVPADVVFYAYACAQCGYCVPTCEQYSGRGWMSQSPRGKYLYLREVAEGREKFDREMVDSFLLCTTCEVCNNRCQLQLPVEHSWMAMRGVLVGDMGLGTFPPFEMMAASLRGERDIWAGKKEHRADWVPPDMAARLKDSGEVLYFAGCTASFVNTDVAEASVRLLADAGVDLAYMGTDEACCGIPMKVAGKWDLFEEIYEHNVAEARRRGAKTIVTSCPACGLVWKEIYASLARDRGEEYEFEVKHYSEVVADAISDGRLTFDHAVEDQVVAFHDSCHMGRAQGVYDPPRAMLDALPGARRVEMEHNRQDGLCCGSVLTLVGEMPVAPVLGGARLQEAIDVGADTVVALCPCCQVQLRDSVEKNDFDLKVTDLARFAAEGLGYKIEDRTEHSMYMWSFFERFIILMRPDEMAGLMSEIFPQMMDAMPFGMKPAMRAMRYVPGGLALLGAMMPLLFPLMAPSVLGKVMPDMISAVRRRVGEMPPDMEELVPDLLPATMESLMPTYLPQLIPHLTPRMVEYIRSEM